MNNAEKIVALKAKIKMLTEGAIAGDQSLNEQNWLIVDAYPVLLGRIDELEETLNRVSTLLDNLEKSNSILDYNTMVKDISHGSNTTIGMVREAIKGDTR